MADPRPILVSLEAEAEDICQAGETFAKDHGLKLIQHDEGMEDVLILVFSDDGLELREPGDQPGGGMVVEYSNIDLRTGAGNLSRKQPLPRAIGKETTTVLDATAGLGYDAALLACMGYRVQAVERSPVIGALLADGVRRAKLIPELAQALDDRLEIIVGEAKQVMETIKEKPEAVYLDPMYPPRRKKSALAKKHIRLVRQIVGADDDSKELLEVALRCATKRVVVKRPVYAEPLGGEPSLSFKGKLVRYDVYLAQT